MLYLAAWHRLLPLLLSALLLLLLLCCQVVDGNWGLGVSIPKYVFRVNDKKRYKPAVVCGSSMPV
jgi:hypothetical protein